MGTRTQIAILSAAMVLLTTQGDAQNVINHATTIVSTNTGLVAKGLDIRILPSPQIIAYYQDSQGKEEAFSWPCALGTCGDDTPAEVLSTIQALNVVNLTSNSLLRRVGVKVCTDFPSRFPNGCSVP